MRSGGLGNRQSAVGNTCRMKFNKMFCVRIEWSTTPEDAHNSNKVVPHQEFKRTRITFSSQFTTWNESSWESKEKMLKMICTKMLKLLNFIFHSFPMLRASSRWKISLCNYWWINWALSWNEHFCKSSWLRIEIWYPTIQVHSESSEWINKIKQIASTPRQSQANISEPRTDQIQGAKFFVCEFALIKMSVSRKLLKHSLVT